MNDKKEATVEICVSIVIILVAVALLLLAPQVLEYLLMVVCVAAIGYSLDGLGKTRLFKSLRFPGLCAAVIIVLLIAMCVAARMTWSASNDEEVHESAYEQGYHDGYIDGGGD